MENNISKKFTFRELLIFSMPSIIMMMFMSLYTIVDGFFVSRFVGTDALSAINIAYPVINIIIGIGVMFATGGSAIVALKMGERRSDEAKSYFTLIVITVIILCSFISIVTLIFRESIVSFLGAKGSITELVSDYLTILMIFAPINGLQLLFQSFFVTAGKPTLGLILTVMGGIFNMIFDYILIVPFEMGIKGAAYATVGSYFIPVIGGIILFITNKKGLCFRKPILDIFILLKSSSNGSSEMVTNLSGSIITFLFNIYMLKYAGSNGVAAITAALYVQFLMTAFYLGFSIGVAPLISYNYGASENNFLKYIIKNSIKFIFICSFIIFIIAFLGSEIISSIFFGYGTEVYNISVYGLKIFAISFLFSGINIFGSGMFTALGNGFISALISFSRTLLFTTMGIVILSIIFEITGLWLAIPFGEFITVIVTIYCFKMLKTKYNIF